LSTLEDSAGAIAAFLPFLYTLYISHLNNFIFRINQPQFSHAERGVSVGLGVAVIYSGPRGDDPYNKVGAIWTRYIYLFHRARRDVEKVRLDISVRARPDGGSRSEYNSFITDLRQMQNKNPVKSR